MAIVTLTIDDLPALSPDGELRDAIANTTAFDGLAPISDQALIDAEAGKRRAVIIHERREDAPPRSLGYAVYGLGELEFFILPTHRGHGWGRRGLALLTAMIPSPLTAWSHGDHPAARVLATQLGFTPVRRLLRLVRNNVSAGRERDDTRSLDAAGTALHKRTTWTIERFHSDRDAKAWVELNATVFRDHPEQGQLTLADLEARMKETWFDPAIFLVARTSKGVMVGFAWSKIEPHAPQEAEIYALGVDPAYAGAGMGRSLMNASLDRLAARDVKHVSLYVEADNVNARRLYRSLGFAETSADVQYRRTSTSDAESPDEESVSVSS